MSGGPGSGHKTMRKEREEDRFNLYLQYIRRGKFHTEASRLAKINPRAVRERQRTDPQFRQDCEDAHAEFQERVEGVLVDAAFGVVHYAKDAEGRPVTTDEGKPVVAQRDTKAALEWLKARNASIFNPNKQVDVNVQHNVALPFNEFHKLRAELEARRPAALAPGMDEIIDAEVIECDDSE